MFYDYDNPQQSMLLLVVLLPQWPMTCTWAGNVCNCLRGQSSPSEERGVTIVSSYGIDWFPRDSSAYALMRGSCAPRHRSTERFVQHKENELLLLLIQLLFVIVPK